MDNLRVKTWEDWETLCKYWMAHIAWTNFRVQTNYQVYGRRGQRQHGIDIQPVLPGCGIVGQSKFIQGAFKLEDLNAELAKTNSYKGPITEYYLLTTADKCTTIQNARTYQPISHTREDGSTFNVHVLYWTDVYKLDFLPSEVKNNLFPEAKNLFGAEVSAFSPEELLDKVEKLKILLRKTFSEQNIKWLETWDFGTYKIYSKDYDVFNLTYLDWSRVEIGIRNNNQRILFSYLDSTSRIEFYATWPVSKSLFYVLEEFRKIAYNYYITGELDGDETYLTISDLPHRDSIAYKMRCAATDLSQAIREIK